MRDHYGFQLRVLDRAVEQTLRVQCMDGASPLFGTVEDIGQGVTCGQSGLSVARQLIEGYCVPGSARQGDETLLERACLAVSFTLGMQHEDGTLDLLTTNFHDGAETSFAMQTIGPAYLLLRMYGTGAAVERRLAGLIETFVNRAADGILAGGFHTPNHRWVVSSALALCWKITGREECLGKMRALLNEGIDCDEEGEYTERSAGVYNIVCDRSLILLAETMDMPRLLEHVSRNLAMVEKYIEPDHTVNTLNSARQDVGTSPDWRIYYGCYLFMALRTGDRGFAWIADEMMAQSLSEPLFHERAAGPGFEFFYFLLADPERLARMATLEGEPVRFNFAKHFVSSGIVRARRGDVSLTIIEKQPMFALLRLGPHPVGLRLAGCFYSKGQFEAQSIEDTPDGWRLRFAVRWGYKGPLPEKPATSDWRLMDHSRRPDVFMQDFGFDVDVRFLGDGASFGVKGWGQAGVPVKLELMLEPGGRLVTDSVELRARPGDYVYQKCAACGYVYPDRHELAVTGGFHSHYFGENMRGALPGDEKHFFLTMTAETPFERLVTLKYK